MKNFLFFLLVAVAISSCHCLPSRYPENYPSQMEGPNVPETGSETPSDLSPSCSGPPGKQSPQCGPCFLDSKTCEGRRTRYAESCEECCHRFRGESYKETVDGQCCTCKRDFEDIYSYYDAYD